MLDRKYSKVRVDKQLKMGQGATIVVTSSTGTESTIDLAELAALDGIAAADLAKIDGITNGTGAAGKAVVLNAGGGANIPGGFAMHGATVVTTQASALTTQTLAALTTQAVSTLTTVNFSALTTAPVSYLTTTQIAALQTTVNALATELETMKVNANKVVGAVPTLNTNNTAVASILHNLGATA